jgi:hypothetical protein
MASDEDGGDGAAHRDADQPNRVLQSERVERPQELPVEQADVVVMFRPVRPAAAVIVETQHMESRRRQRRHIVVPVAAGQGKAMYHHHHRLIGGTVPAVIDLAVGQTDELPGRLGASLIIEGQLGEPVPPIG